MSRRAAAVLVAALAVSGCAGPEHQALARQLAAAGKGPVLSLQGYRVADGEQGRRLRERWRALAERMKEKPGFVVARLSIGADGSGLWLAHSEWEDAAALRQAFADPAVRALEGFMPRRVFGHLFRLGEPVTPGVGWALTPAGESVL